MTIAYCDVTSLYLFRGLAPGRPFGKYRKKSTGKKMDKFIYESHVQYTNELRHLNFRRGGWAANFSNYCKYATN